MGVKKSIYFRDENLFEWMEEKIESGRFRNRAHAVEEALIHLRSEEEDDGSYAF